MSNDDLTTLARIRGLLEVTRLVRSEADLTRLLSEIARAVKDALGFQVVVINVYRPAWDDFVVAAVEGGDEVRRALMGATYGWDVWRRVLDERYNRKGAYYIREGDFDWSEHGARFIPDLPATDDPQAWHAEDELFVPFRHSDGHLLGIMSVGTPENERRPTDAPLFHRQADTRGHLAREIAAKIGEPSRAHKREATRGPRTIRYRGEKKLVRTPLELPRGHGTRQLAADRLVESRQRRSRLALEPGHDQHVHVYPGQRFRSARNLRGLHGFAHPFIIA